MPAINWQLTTGESDKKLDADGGQIKERKLWIFLKMILIRLWHFSWIPDKRNIAHRCWSGVFLGWRNWKFQTRFGWHVSVDQLWWNNQSRNLSRVCINVRWGLSLGCWGKSVYWNRQVSRTCIKIPFSRLYWLSMSELSCLLDIGAILIDFYTPYSNKISYSARSQDETWTVKTTEWNFLTSPFSH